MVIVMMMMTVLMMMIKIMTEYFITVEQGWARDGGPRGGAGGRQLPHGHGEVQVHSSRKE